MNNYKFTLTFGYKIKKKEIIDKFQIFDPGKYEFEIYTNPKTGKQIQEKKWIQPERKYFVFEDQEINSKYGFDFEDLLLKIVSRFNSIKYDEGREYEFVFFYSPLKRENESHCDDYPIEVQGTSEIKELEDKLSELRLFGEWLNSLGLNVGNPEVFIRTKIF